MKNLLPILLILGISCRAFGQNVIDRTNNVLALSASASPMTVYVEYEARLKVTAFRGSIPVDLTNTFVRWVITDRRDGRIKVNVLGEILDAGQGVVSAVASMTKLEPAAYLGTLSAYDVETSNKVTDLSLNNISLVNWCADCPSAGGASVTIGASTTIVNVAGSTFASGAVQVAVSSTNLIQASIDSNAFTGATFTINQTTIISNQVQQIFTNQWLPQTTNGGVIYQYVNTNATGGGSALPVNGERPTNLTFNASYPFTVSTVTNADGMTITYGLSGNAGTIVIPAGNTSTSEYTFFSTNEQFYTAGPTATQLFFFAITPAAGFSPGSLTQGFYPCTGSQVFAVYMPQGGLAVSNGTAPGGWGYVRGGSATSTNGSIAVSGAGSLAVLTGTNMVLHGGAPGGSASQSGRTPAGGPVGGYVSATTAGGPGTQTNHGAAATATAGATAGTSTNGGNATAAGGTAPGSGGGGGKFSGGAGCGGGNALNTPGGAGSSDIDHLLFGFTDRSATDTASPPGTSAPQYKSPYGVAILSGSTITNGNRGNASFLSIVSYPSP